MCGSRAWCATITWPSASAMRPGGSFAPSSQAKQGVLAAEGVQSLRTTPAKTVAGCGQRVHKRLSVRTHVCPRCGLVLDRDENAARNMLAVGQQWVGQDLRGLAEVSAGRNREAPCL
jgi:hypothetical protein